MKKWVVLYELSWPWRRCPYVRESFLLQCQLLLFFQPQPTAYVQLFLDLCPTIKSYVENLCVVHLHENKL